MKPLTRAQMRRAAMALLDYRDGDGYETPSIEQVAKRWRVPADELVDEACNPRSYCNEGVDWRNDCLNEASMLMSEAVRPAGHDGEG
jgi:hypothetical protein